MNGTIQRTDGDGENARGARLNDGSGGLARQFLTDHYEKNDQIRTIHENIARFPICYGTGCLRNPQ